MEPNILIKQFFKQPHLGIILILIAVAVLWNTVVVYPLKIFVVFMHEISHGLAAVATGGQIQEIVVVAQEGGHAVTLGGSPFWTLSAGYLGSVGWGGLILILALRAHLDKSLSILIGVGMVLMSLFYVRNSFGLFFGIGFGGIIIVIGIVLNKAINSYIVQIIGLTSCLYAILDIKSDILDRTHLRSDARMLAEMTNIPTIVWGILWIIIAITATVFFVNFAGKRRSKPTKAPNVTRLQ